jgi:perosamine synthetase
MSNLQAAVGLAQLEKLNETVKIRIKNRKIYNHFLKNCNQIIVPELKKKFSKNIFWVYPIILKNKKKGVAKLVNYLRKNGIITRPMFYPLHNQPVLKKFKIKKSMRLKNSEFFRNNGIYLPSGLTLKKNDIKFICSKIIDFFNAK